MHEILDILKLLYQMKQMNVTLEKFDDSFNFILGLSGLPDDMDILNNPYVEFLGYEYEG